MTRIKKSHFDAGKWGQITLYYPKETVFERKKESLLKKIWRIITNDNKRGRG